MFNFAFIPPSLEPGIITFEDAVDPNTRKSSQNSAETSSKNIRIKCVVSVTVFLRINFYYLFYVFSLRESFLTFRPPKTVKILIC